MPEPSSTILLVDDEDAIQSLLTYPLERDGYRVVQARDGDEALRRFAEEDVDLVVLDIMLPRVDGLEVCRRLRAESTVPIIMLTARDDELDKVLGLELGADDYITKPFSIREFRSRVRALLRRAATPHVSGPPRRGDRPRRRRRRPAPADGRGARRAGAADVRRVRAPRAARVASPGVVFSRRQLLERIRGSADYREPRTIDVHVRHLREKIERDSREPELILTVRGAGIPVPATRMRLPGGIRTTLAVALLADRRRRARRRVPDGRAVARAAPRRRASSTNSQRDATTAALRVRTA